MIRNAPLNYNEVGKKFIKNNKINHFLYTKTKK